MAVKQTQNDQNLSTLEPAPGAYESRKGYTGAGTTDTMTQRARGEASDQKNMQGATTGAGVIPGVGILGTDGVIRQAQQP